MRLSPLARTFLAAAGLAIIAPAAAALAQQQPPGTPKSTVSVGAGAVLDAGEAVAAGDAASAGALASGVAAAAVAGAAAAGVATAGVVAGGAAAGVERASTLDDTNCWTPNNPKTNAANSNMLSG